MSPTATTKIVIIAKAMNYRANQIFLPPSTVGGRLVRFALRHETTNKEIRRLDVVRS